MNSFRELIVWQKAHDLTLGIYRSTKDFPAHEQYGLTSQMRRASVSVGSNIAEGFGRISAKDKEHFYVMASASIRELQSQLSLATDLAYISKDIFDMLDADAEEVHRMLNGLLRTHRSPKP